jgi:transcriptional regulator with XRE-family HTH domain
MSTPEDFYRFVRRQREQHGLSIREAARRAGISEGGWRLVEQGAGNHTADTLACIQAAINGGFASGDDRNRRQVADRARQARLSRGMTMKEAAETSGVSHVTWRRIENARTVKPGSYAAVDRFLKLPLGTTALFDSGGPPIAEAVAGGGLDRGFEALARLIPKLELHELNRLSDMVSTAIAIRSGGVS